jgi:glycosyltransferase involved in cell wall biosynthesis
VPWHVIEVFQLIKMKKLTILIPVLNEEKNLPILYKRLSKVLQNLNGKIIEEVIILDNRSTDNTKLISKEIVSNSTNWKYVRLSRNFGYHNSLACGFDLATGDGLVVLAGDLQEPPELIPTMINKWEEGYEIIYGILNTRNDSSPLKTLGAKLFYPMIELASETDLPKNATDFRLIDRKVIDAVIKMREPDRYLRGLIHWTGFKQVGFNYDRDKRIHGKSIAGIWYSTKWALNAIICFSNLPLRMISYFGILTLLFSLLSSIYFVYAKLYPPKIFTIPPTGTTIIILLLLFVIGMNSLFLGLIGEYIGRIYTQGKNRPLYIIDETENFN